MNQNDIETLKFLLNKVIESSNDVKIVTDAWNLLKELEGEFI